MKIFSTFSGIGGFEIGIHNAWLRSQNERQTIQGSQARDSQGRSEQLHQYGDEGLSFVGYSEIDKYAIKVYEKQFGGECENCRLARERERDSGSSGRQETLDSQRTRLPQTVGDNDNTKNERSESDRTTCEHSPRNFGDITKINADELPDFDCLVGGFPCQAFSIAGKRKGFEDTRGTLFFDLARILRAKQPRLFVFENVKGLLSHDSGRTFKTIIEAIDELGYDCQWQVLNSKNHGVPQNRERVYIVGHLRGTARPEVFPIVGTDGEDTQPDKGRSAELFPTIRATHYKNGDNQPLIKQLNQPTHSNDRVYDSDGISPTLNTMQGGNRQPFVKVPEATAIDYTVKSDKKDFRVFSDKGIAPSLQARSDTHKLGDDIKIRRLTPLETERLQGFPDNWTAEGIDGAISDTQRYKMCGNAVTTNVVQAVFERILK